MYERNIHTISTLLITEDLPAAGRLARFLYSENFQIKVATTSAHSMDILSCENVDIVLLDISSAESGYPLCHTIKEQFDIPLIIISPLDDEQSVVTGLDMGGDDYITKPFSNRELLSRVKSVLRRGNKSRYILEYKNIRVDTIRGLVTKDGRELFLSALEYRLLLVFLSNKGRVLSREILLEEIWDIGGGYVSDNTLTVYIKRIREKIEDTPSTPQIIKTVRGKGYRLGG
ncbi:MAG: response regulator transcription factor [Oscillospiraceae bacterium]|nr:response regulator transcription factor [Oscillospiraceae bacterium]